MARNRMGFRKTLRQQLEQANAADRFYAAMAGVEPQNQSVIAPKRERAAPRDLEGPVVSAIDELLAVHPKIMWAARFNSGAASFNAANGKYQPIWFHRFLRMPAKMRMPDFFGLLMPKIVWETAVPIAIEAKAPGWTKPKDDREHEQAAFLAMVRDCGGIGIFATSADDVAKALA